MNIDDNLGKVFNLEDSEPEPVDDTEIVPVQEGELVQSVDSLDDDFNQARKTLKELMTTNTDLINNIAGLAKQTELVRYFEVAGQLIKAQSEIAMELIGAHKQKRSITGEESKIGTQNNTVFVGSTSELLDLIARKKLNDK